MLDLKDMKYSSLEVGKNIKSAAHEYRWEFVIESQKVCIQFFIYRIFNKRKVVYNQKVLREEQSGENNTYSYEFIMDGHHYKIIQTLDLTSLYIDGESFDYNYTLERSKKEFMKNERVSSDIFTEEDDGIQASNEIDFFKKENPKQIINLNFAKKNSNNGKINNLNKFKFNIKESNENNYIRGNNNNKNNNNINSNHTNENNNKNLIDLDDFNNDINVNNKYSDFFDDIENSKCDCVTA